MNLDDQIKETEAKIAELEAAKQELIKNTQNATKESRKKEALSRFGKIRPVEEVYYKFEYSDFDNFIEIEYGISVEVVVEEEMNNYSAYTYAVSKCSLSSYEQKKLNTWMNEGKGWPSVRTLLTDLVNRDRLPEGRYLIEVFW